MMGKEYISKILDSFEKLDLTIEEVQAEKFFRYYECLLEWNQKMNLTAITEFDEVLLKHFVDSVAVVKVMDLNKIESVIDVGTGAGFPGVPLKIMFPHLKITLLDSLQKRIQFLETIITELKLNHIEALHGRAEDFGQSPEYREQYDLCVSRAVANLSTLSEYCVPFIKVGGYFISYKAERIEEEVKTAESAIRKLHCESPQIRKVLLPESELNRSFVQVRKKGHLDKKYPRKAGMPAKKPL